ncbi:aldo/keto reductase [Stakelama tenebrarum]|uniref:Aldo/keto reductase n=1 Tax=Stakelama tenebrarum TaxID=2711215 RepID=A0A6G6Y3D3_9SPHN|nr:aldo/keto reductase [Sphingosinithalassobacter tenebrarum]QIG79410.1 aldo/keto reductase [Sphingosinithalassobacter tenebrarum]
MRYNKLGNTGLIVSELCLGTMTFGGGEGMWRQIGQLQQDDADTLMKTAIDGGINFVDTANVYAEGLSEKILGQSIRNLGIKREELVVATKVLGPMHAGPNGAGASRGHILTQVEKSLERLQLDYIDLYQIHGFDPTTPIEETLAALDTLVQHGKVRYIGLSNWAAWQIAKAATIARHRDYAPIASLQAYYTIAGRDLEREIAPMLQSEGIGLMVWSPLAGGFLSGKYTRQSEGEGRRADGFDFPPVDKERAYDIVEIFQELAQAKGKSVAQLALAWLLYQPVVSSVIVGAKRKDQLADNLGAVDVEFTAAELERLDEASKLTPEYPHWMLERQGTYRASPDSRRVVK